MALAHLLSDDRRPPPELWKEDLVSSRLLEYEVWGRLHTTKRAHSHRDVARFLFARLAWLELHPSVLERALDPFPVPVRTLDALHLASVSFLRERGREVSLATYDDRLAEAAHAMDVPLADLP